jgi:anti-sigma regulatory factor (Ser/Thr protein kinase)
MSQKTFSASLDHLHEMLEFIADYVKKHASVDHHIHQIILASEEVLVNIIYYAYSPDQLTGSKSIDIRCEFNPHEGKIVISFEDQGKAFNPLEANERHLHDDLENHIGGQGIPMLKKLMDSVQYQRIGNTNVLRIEKSLKNHR